MTFLPSALRNAPFQASKVFVFLQKKKPIDVLGSSTVVGHSHPPHSRLQVVNVAQGMSIGPALYLWTHRLTCADVVSVVTTTRPSASASTTTTHKTKYIAGGGLPVGSVDGGRDVLRRGPPFDGSFGRLEGVGSMYS